MHYFSKKETIIVGSIIDVLIGVLAAATVFGDTYRVQVLSGLAICILAISIVPAVVLSVKHNWFRK